MTSYNDAREAILLAFTTAWAERAPYVFDNEDFTAPKDAPWARVAVRHSGGGQETIGPPGARRFERRGTVFVQVFVPQNTGTIALGSLATVVRETFEGVTLAGTTVRFSGVIVRDGGPDGSWFGTTVEAPFTYDETR